MSDLRASRLQAVVGHALRLRDEVLARLVATWSGPVKRTVEPDDVDRLVLDLGTASLFEEPALRVVRAGAPWVKKHREALLKLVGEPAEAGVLLLVCPPPERRDDALLKALAKAKALHETDEPDAKTVVDWLTARLHQGGLPVERPRQVAEDLVAALGDEADGLLAAIDLLAAYRGGRPIDPAAVADCFAATAARPVWEFTDAVLSGDARRAIGLLHAQGAERPEQYLNALVSELRKTAACLESADDAEVARLAGLRGRPNCYHTRKRATALGRDNVLRLLNGAVQASRSLRHSGVDAEAAVETLVLHAQRVVRTRLRH